MDEAAVKAMMNGTIKYAEGAPNAEKLGWRLGCQAWSFNLFTFEEALAMSKALGLKVIEAYPGQQFVRGHKLDHTMTDGEIEELRTMLQDAGIKLVNYGVVPLPNDEAECRKVFNFAEELGIDTIVSEPPEEAIPLIDDLAAEYGIDIAIHNHPKPSHYWDPRIVSDAINQTGDQIGVCADTGHWLRSGVNPLEAIKMLGNTIKCFHFKDLNVAGMQGHDVPWGTGVAGVEELLTEIRRQRFTGVFSIEYEHNWEKSLPEIAKCVAKFDEIAAKLGQQSAGL